MLNLGMSEILLFAIITLIVLGPDKLPEAARFAGRWYGKIKRLISSVQSDLDRELRLSELQQQMQQELIKIQQLEQKMQEQMQIANPLDLETDILKKDSVDSSKDALQHYQPCVPHTQKAPFVARPSSQPLSPHIELKTAV